MGNMKKDHYKNNPTDDQSVLKHYSCDYERFFYVKSFLKDKYFDLICKTDRKQMNALFSELMNISGFAGHERKKLFHLIEKWNNLLFPVPVKYLDLIGADREILDAKYQKDIIAFKRALKRRYVPDSFIVVFSNGSLRIGLPASLSEEKAIEYVRNWETKMPYKRKSIQIKNLKSLNFCPDGEYYITTYPPVLSFRNEIMYVVNEVSTDQQVLRKNDGTFYNC